MGTLEALAHQLTAFETCDSPQFQRKLRVLQALWRSERGFPMGVKQTGEALGSMLEKSWAETSFGNFLTPRIREILREELRREGTGRFIEKNRLWSNLLSSQPLAFNLFAIPSRDLRLATAWFQVLCGDSRLRVTAIEFEWSPGRGNPTFTGDRSAFDVLVRAKDGEDAPRFFAIEVKYHENLRKERAKIGKRHLEVARLAGWFREDQFATLSRPPLQQLWRDHLLAASLPVEHGWGAFAIMYPAINSSCAAAIAKYRTCLARPERFQVWTLEEGLAALRAVCSDQWVHEFEHRYLDLRRVDAAIARIAP